MFNYEAKAREYREYKQMIEELEYLTECIAEEIKAALIAEGKTKLNAGAYKISYTDVSRRSLDQQKLEALLGDLSPFMKVSKYKRFSVA